MTGKKRTNQRIAFWIFRILGLIVVGILFWILGFIIWHGAGVINWKFLTTAPTDGMTGGGIFPAIVGTFCLIAGSMVVAFPLGVMSAIYTTEYAGNGKIVRFIRIMTNNLGSIPSIIFGLFGMALFVNALGFGDSIIAGSFTLGLLALPLVIRTTEEALKAVPDSYRTGSLALGATKLQTIWRVVLPTAFPNITTGLILSIGRVSGETAPILFTAAAYFLPKAADEHLRPGDGAPLPPLRDSHERHRPRSHPSHGLRHGAGAYRHRAGHEPARLVPQAPLRQKKVKTN